jgi:MoxR-like ATPase
VRWEEVVMTAVERAAQFKQDFAALRAEIGKVIVGLEEVVEGVLTCLLADGHALLEGVPGLGKTLLVRTLAQCLDVKFSRIQFTPDLMPADVVGTNIIVESPEAGRQFRFQPGPVFGNIILADEVNRATPKTQSALLEAMQEHSVTVAGAMRKLPEPFFVLATQNPIEMEGTYPLPEAQLDRFLFKLLVGYPSLEQLGMIIDRTTGAEMPQVAPVLDGPRVLEMRAVVREVPVAPHVREYALDIVLATHPGSPAATEQVNRFVRYGASPRGAQALILAGKVSALLDGRWNVSFDDIQKAAPAGLRHRLLLNFEGQAEGVTTDEIIGDIIQELAARTKPTLEV